MVPKKIHHTERLELLWSVPTIRPARCGTAKAMTVHIKKQRALYICILHHFTKQSRHPRFHRSLHEIHSCQTSSSSIRFNWIQRTWDHELRELRKKINKNSPHRPGKVHCPCHWTPFPVLGRKLYIFCTCIHMLHPGSWLCHTLLASHLHSLNSSNEDMSRHSQLASAGMDLYQAIIFITLSWKRMFTYYLNKKLTEQLWF